MSFSPEERERIRQRAILQAAEELPHIPEWRVKQLLDSLMPISFDPRDRAILKQLHISPE